MSHPCRTTAQIVPSRLRLCKMGRCFGQRALPGAWLLPGSCYRVVLHATRELVRTELPVATLCIWWLETVASRSTCRAGRTA